MGLSVSEVVAKTIEAILGIGVTAIAALSGLSASPEGKNEGDTSDSGSSSEKTPHGPPTKATWSSFGLFVYGKQEAKRMIPRKPQRIEVNAVPLAAFTVFLAIGSSLGVICRTHQWLAVTPDEFSSRWRATGIEDAELRRSLLKAYYPGMDTPTTATDSALLVQKWSALTGLPSEQVARRVFENSYPTPDLMGLRQDPQAILHKWSGNDEATNHALAKQLLGVAYPSSPASPDASRKGIPAATTPKPNSEATTHDSSKGALYAGKEDTCDDYFAHYASGVDDSFRAKHGQEVWISTIYNQCSNGDKTKESVCLNVRIENACKNK